MIFFLITIPYLYGVIYHGLKIFMPLQGMLGRSMQLAKNMGAFITMAGSLYFFLIKDYPVVWTCTCHHPG